jgi:predicted dehydrogenase
MARPLRIALVGCGIISENHIKAYKELSDRAEVVACCDIDPVRASERAALAGNARSTTDFADILADDTIDAIDLCTPPHLHCGAVVAAVKAGKHVTCQKPLARTLAECDTMIAAAKDADRVLFYAEMNRVNLGARAVKSEVKNGRIGTLVGFQATFAYWQGGEYMNTAWRYNPAIAGGGQLLDSAIHAIALMRDVCGDIDSVSCFTTNFRPELGGDDTSSLILRFKNGALGTLYSTQATSLWYTAPNYAVFGTEGHITMGGVPYAVILHKKDLPDEQELLLDARKNPFVAMASDFLDAVLDNVPVTSTAKDGREDLRLVLAAYESDRLQKAIFLDDFGLPDSSPVSL